MVACIATIAIKSVAQASAVETEEDLEDKPINAKPPEMGVLLFLRSLFFLENEIFSFNDMYFIHLGFGIAIKIRIKRLFVFETECIRGVN